MRRCRANAKDTKTPEVYTKLPPLDIGIAFPVNTVVNSGMYRVNLPYLSRAARRAFSNEKGSPGVKVLPERTGLSLACVEGRVSVRERFRTPSGSK